MGAFYSTVSDRQQPPLGRHTKRRSRRRIDGRLPGPRSGAQRRPWQGPSNPHDQCSKVERQWVNAPAQERAISTPRNPATPLPPPLWSTT